MSKVPCCEGGHTKRTAWTKKEDLVLLNYIRAYGEGKWQALPKAAGLNRCGKSCRLRYFNYLRAGVRRENYTDQEDELIIELHSKLGNKWSQIAKSLPGRTDNGIKNHWNTHIMRKLYLQGIDPVTHQPIAGFSEPHAALINPFPTPPSTNTAATEEEAPVVVPASAANNDNNDNNNNMDTSDNNNNNEFHVFNVFSSSKQVVVGNADSASGGSGVHAEEGDPEISLELSLAPPRNPNQNGNVGMFRGYNLGFQSNPESSSIFMGSFVAPAAAPAPAPAPAPLGNDVFNSGFKFYGPSLTLRKGTE